MQRRLTIIILAAAVFFSMPIHHGSAGTKMDFAQKVMKNVRQLANVYEEGEHLVVEFHEYLFPYDINKRLQFVRAVADADCVITGKPRLIFYYNPDGKQIAQADPINGIRLKN
jgi:predicted SnoaL-like aldol condensation-catalyzing enzyme